MENVAFTTHQFLAASSPLWVEVLVPVLTTFVGLALGWFSPFLRDFIQTQNLRRRVPKRVSGLDDAATSAGSESSGESAQRVAGSLQNIARTPIRGPRLYVSSMEIREFRCFESSSVSLHYPGDGSDLRLPNVNLILGDNGSGKSTLLKAIAIAALGPVLESSGFYSYYLVRQNRASASLIGHFILDEPSQVPAELTGRVDISRTGDYELVDSSQYGDEWRNLYDESNLAFLVLGYGVNRRVADDRSGDLDSLTRSRRRRRYQRIASLFEENAVLTPLSAWLPDLRRSRRTEVEELLSSLLPEGTLLTAETASEAVFHHKGVSVPFRALSDGYQSFIGWVADLLFQIESASDGKIPLDQVGGIVLVDEVDLLLHPTWQLEVVPKIAKALPNLQFVFTTHSPIVAGTLESANILAIRSSERGVAELVRLSASIHGLNAEQILLSSYFELKTTRAPEAHDELRLLAERALEGDKDATILYMRMLTGRTTRSEIEGHRSSDQ
jgi:hypothetical protein